MANTKWPLKFVEKYRKIHHSFVVSLQCWFNMEISVQRDKQNNLIDQVEYTVLTGRDLNVRF